MLSLNEFTKGGNLNSIISKLFESRDFAHKAHLRSKSFSQHEALGEFYNAVTLLADELFEVYSGQYGMQKLDFSNVGEEDPVAYMENLGKMLVNSHKLIDSKDTHLHNILDEIVALTFRTVYKLKYLK